MKLSLSILALGTFAVGTAELLIAGILPLMAQDLGVSEGMTGQLVTVYAVVFALGGPLLTTLTARINRRNLLLMALALFIVGSLFTIVLADYGLVMLARIFAACGSAVYTAIATGVAASIVPDQKRGFAISMVVAGWTVSSIVGAPLGTLLGQNFGWRASFVLVIALSTLAALGIWLRLPKVAPTAAPHLGQQLALAGRPVFLLALLVSVLFLGGQYVVYTYLAPFLRDTTHLDGATISLMLLVYGLAGTIGNFLGGFGTDRLGVNRTLIIGITVNALALFFLSIFGMSALSIGLVVAVWSLSSWSFTSAQQCRLLGLAPEAAELALSLNLSAYSIGIAAGSSLGGMVISQSSAANLGWIGGIVILVAFGVMLISLVLAYRVRRATTSLENVVAKAV